MKMEIKLSPEFYKRLAELELGEYRDLRSIPADEPLDGDQTKEAVEELADMVLLFMNEQEGNI